MKGIKKTVEQWRQVPEKNPDPGREVLVRNAIGECAVAALVNGHWWLKPALNGPIMEWMPIPR